MFLPNRPQPLPQPQAARKPTPLTVPAPVPIPAPAPNPPLSRTAAINKARLQAVVGMAAGVPQAAAGYVPSSADLAASVRLAASGHLAHSGASLAPSAFYMPNAFLSGKSSLASTVFTPTSAQDMQVRMHFLPHVFISTYSCFVCNLCQSESCVGLNTHELDTGDVEEEFMDVCNVKSHVLTPCSTY